MNQHRMVCAQCGYPVDVDRRQERCPECGMSSASPVRAWRHTLAKATILTLWIAAACTVVMDVMSVRAVIRALEYDPLSLFGLWLPLLITAVSIVMIAVWRSVGKGALKWRPGQHRIWAAVPVAFVVLLLCMIVMLA